MSVLCSSERFPFHATDKQTTVSGFASFNSLALKSEYKTQKDVFQNNTMFLSYICS